MSFETHRPQLFQLAYGMVGSIATAEDLVQEAWLRYQRTDGIDNAGGWLRTVVSRLALDELKSARARREVYPGTWLPEPLPTDSDPDPERSLALAESLSMATLAVLEQLSPAERAAFLLREAFEVDYTEIAALLERSEPATRQLVRRARTHLRANRPRFETRPDAHMELLAAFAAATMVGDLEGLKGLLAGDVRVTSDGGGKATAAVNPIDGPDRVARLLVGLASKAPADTTYSIQVLNGQLGVVVQQGSTVVSASVFSIADGRITALHIVRNPDKLGHLTAGTT